MRTWEAIGGGLSVAVDAHCRVSEDGLLLAKFAAPKADDTAVDLGTGNGVIPLYWCRREPPRHITAVEREAAFCALAMAAIDKHDLTDRITLLHTDWNDKDAMPEAGTASLVTCNPPYFPYGSSRPRPDALRDAARREDSPTVLADVCRAAGRLLTANGRFCLCHRPERLEDVFSALREAGVVPRRLQFVQSREGAAPWLFLLEAAKSGTLQVSAPLVLHKIGTHTAVYKRLY